MPVVQLCCSAPQTHRGSTLTVVLLCRLAPEALKGAPWLGAYSVVQCLRRLTGQLLYCSALMLACGEREAMVMAPPSAHDSVVITMLPWLPGFPLLALLTTISSLTSPPPVSLHSAAALAPGLLPATAPSRRPAFLSGVCMAVGKDCLILILFRLPQISCFTLSLKCFSSDSDSCSAVRIRPLLQFPQPQRAGPVLLTLLFSPLVPSSYRVLHDSIYSFPLVRYFCPLSAGGLHALLCLKVYS